MLLLPCRIEMFYFRSFHSKSRSSPSLSRASENICNSSIIIIIAHCCCCCPLASRWYLPIWILCAINKTIPLLIYFFLPLSTSSDFFIPYDRSNIVGHNSGLKIRFGFVIRSGDDYSLLLHRNIGRIRLTLLFRTPLSFSLSPFKSNTPTDACIWLSTVVTSTNSLAHITPLLKHSSFVRSFVITSAYCR